MNSSERDNGLRKPPFITIEVLGAAPDVRAIISAAVVGSFAATAFGFYATSTSSSSISSRALPNLSHAL